MDHQKHSVAHGWTRFLTALTLAFTLWAGGAGSAYAQAGQSQVGTGTAASCTFQSLKTALLSTFDPLLVTFNCGANPVVINVTSEITFSNISGSQDITIDGGTPGLITLNATSGRIINQRYLGNLTVKNLTFSAGSVVNCASAPCGGGAIFNPTGILTVIDSTFTGNSATGWLFGGAANGGAIYSRGLLTVTGSTFTNNQALAGNGGAIYTFSATIANTRFSNNTSTFSSVTPDDTGRGGALYARGSGGAPLTLVITGSSFTGNTAGEYGGAIFQPSSIYADSFVVTNSTFSGNSAQVDGGALAIGNPFGGGATKVTNATISGNSVLSGVSGTGAGIAGSAVSLTNTIVSNNAPGNCSGSFSDGGGNVVFGDTTCPGINANPFLGTLTGTLPYFPLVAGSAAINRGIAGECAAAMASPAFGAGGVDQRGMPRRSLYCDSGAFEAQPASLAVVAGSNQGAAVNTQFATVLQAQVRDSVNNKLAGSVVTFTGPASGAGIVNGGGSLSGPGGIAFLGATANGTLGTYNVTVTATGATPANFSLTNRNPNGVTYDGNGETGGSVPVDGNYYPAAGIVTVSGNTGSLTRIGSTFAGWNTAANGTGTNYLGGNTFAINANVTLYARWTPVTYGVTYNANGSTGGTAPVDGNAYAPGATVTVLGNTGALVKTGSTFAGWNTAANGSGTTYATGATFAMGSTNVILYARWTLATYGVTYNPNGSTGGTAPVDGDAYAAGATVIVLGNSGVLVKTGSTFAGWNTAANGTGTTYAGGATFAMGSANVILYARWTPVTYGVTYNANGSTGGTAPVDGNSYSPGATVTVLGNTGALVKTGSTFAGWNTAANGTGTNYAGGATFAIAANATLYARWTPVTYGVTYNANGSTGGTAPVDGNSYAPGSTVVVMANTGALVKTGSTFAGWNTAANGSGTTYATAATFAMGSANVILYARWTPVTYGVTYNVNGSTGGTAPVDGDAYAAGATVIVLGNSGVLVKTGSTFAGWNTAANGGTTYAGGATFAMGSANVILYARWTPVTYGVTYNANGSTGGTAPVDGNAYAPGATVTVLGNTGVLVKTGATFAGWNIAANGGGTTYLGGASFAMGSANVILYARWTPVTYGVTYNANGSTGGAVPADGSAYAPGSTVIVLANTGGLVKTGATFAGWNSAINGTGVNYPASGNASFAMGSANVILYAQWSNPCTLDLDGNNQVDPLTDGLMLLRAMFGLTGTAVTNGAIGSGTPARPTWDKIQPYLNANCGTSFLP